MTSEEIKAIQEKHAELFAHLVAKGETEERAAQILTNHADAVQEEFDSKDEEPGAPVAPDLVAIRDYLREHVEAIEARHERLIDHVNRELGAAEEVPLVERLRSLAARIAELEKPKGGTDAQKAQEAPPA